MHVRTRDISIIKYGILNIDAAYRIVVMKEDVEVMDKILLQLTGIAQGIEDVKIRLDNVENAQATYDSNIKLLFTIPRQTTDIVSLCAEESTITSESTGTVGYDEEDEQEGLLERGDFLSWMSDYWRFSPCFNCFGGH
jgi:hypothetical protein